jgi:amidase/aspartyl-tRNA(Asn)/glutamyl-tRNA(Gln) amidotransferase subunit A
MGNTILAPTDPLDAAGDLCRLGAADLADAYRAGTLSPVEVTEAALSRAEAINPDLNAFTFLDHDGALAAARTSEKRWREGAPLSDIDGVPTTLKDIVWVKGWTVRYGSATTSDRPFEADAPAVGGLRDAGAIFIGQTTTPEFGWKAITDSALFGVTRNPWDRRKTPGGSSGGAAVAAAVGAGVLHLGTDGGGSIRIPASFSGIFGHKPTFGRVAAFPASPFGTVAHIGPMTRSAADGLAMLKAMAGRDLRDWAQGAGRLPPLDAATTIDMAGKRIGYWSRPASGTMDPEVLRLVDAAVAVLSDAGAIVEPVSLPADDLLDLFHRHWFTGAAARIAGVPEEARGAVDPGLLETAREGAGYTATQVVQAQIRRGEFGAAMDRMALEFDFIVSPATSIPAFDAGLELPPGSGFRRWTEWAGFSYPINLSQQPASVLRCGFTAAGLPVGLQIIGARGEDARVLAAADRLETMLSGRRTQSVAHNRNH